MKTQFPAPSPALNALRQLADRQANDANRLNRHRLRTRLLQAFLFIAVVGAAVSLAGCDTGTALDYGDDNSLSSPRAEASPSLDAIPAPVTAPSIIGKWSSGGAVLEIKASGEFTFVSEASSFSGVWETAGDVVTFKFPGGCTSSSWSVIAGRPGRPVPIDALVLQSTPQQWDDGVWARVSL